CSQTVFPTSEICDGLDNDCNGVLDNGVTTTFYRDSDGDGYGDPADVLAACAAPPGYVTNNTDCNDVDPAMHPGAVEICDGKDNNCNGIVDEGCSCVNGSTHSCYTGPAGTSGVGSCKGG